MRRGTLERIVDDAEGFRRTAILSTALELGVFPAIGEGCDTTKALSKKIGASERGLEILLDALVGMRLLVKKHHKSYRLARTSKLLLLPDRRTYIGDSLRLIANPVMWEAMSSLPAAVVRGTPVVKGCSLTGGWSQEYARLSAPFAHRAAKDLYAVVRHIGIKKGGRVLDVGCGCGVYGLTCIKGDRKSRLVCCDSGPVLTVAKEQALKMGLALRTSFVPGDAFKTDLKGQYDVIIASFLFHEFGTADCKRLARRLRQALRPGGMLVVHDFIPDEDRKRREVPLLFAPILLTSTMEGRLYSAAELKEMLQECGFLRFRIRNLQSESTCVIATFSS